MQNDEELLKKRFSELRDRAFLRGVWVYSDFLNMNEQSVLLSAVKTGVTLFGGHENPERAIAVFGDENEFGYAANAPVTCIKVEPLSKKFSDELSHRDFLGSLTALGIKRETLGDIIIDENCGYIFCLQSISGFITENLCKVKHTSVKCAEFIGEVSAAEEKTEEKTVVVASERLDSAISAVYNLSRSESAALIIGGKVFVNSRLTENTSHTPKPGDIISVRGTGRFIWNGVHGETRKGKMRASVKIFM